MASLDHQATFEIEEEAAKHLLEDRIIEEVEFTLRGSVLLYLEDGTKVTLSPDCSRGRVQVEVETHHHESLETYES